MNHQRLIAAADDVLVQGKKLLAELDALSYATPVAAPLSASVGQHYRHVLDHFLCFLSGVETGCINYDDRRRNRRLEADLDYALLSTDSLRHMLEWFGPEACRRRCAVRYTVGYGDAEPLLIQSTFERELAFCVSHAVHHFAIVRLICAQMRVNVPLEFGVAPSTLKYQSAQLAS